MNVMELAILLNITMMNYLLAINFTAFLNTFLYYKSSHPARRTSHIIILFSRFV